MNIRPDQIDILKIFFKLSDKDFSNINSWNETRLRGLLKEIDWLNNETRLIRIQVLNELKSRGLKHDPI